MRPTHRFNLPLLILACAFAPSLLRAEWPTSPYVDVVIDDQLESAYRAIPVADGAGGAIVLWLQVPAGGSGDESLWAVRLDEQGGDVWGGPVHVYDPIAPDQVSDIRACADGAGGAFVVAQVWESGPGVNRLRVFRIAGDGTVPWPGGVAAVSSPIGFSMTLPAITPDGEGGMVVAWRDTRDSGTTGDDIWAQRIDAAGSRLWGAGGAPVCRAAATQSDVDLVTDGAGGAYLVWDDLRSGTGFRVYGQHLLADGSVDPYWAADGKLLVTGSPDASNPRIIGGGAAGGFLVACEIWDGSFNQIRVGRFTSRGDPFWIISGSDDVTGSKNRVRMIPDGQGGAFLAWQDDRANSWSGTEIYVQHIGQGGSFTWGTSGIPAGPMDGSQYDPHLVLDGQGGVFVVWEDHRATYADVYGQRFTSTGSRTWNYSGSALSLGNGPDDDPQIVADDRGGVIAAWIGNRVGYQNDIFAKRIGRHGYLGDAAPLLLAVADIPADQGGVVRLDWARSHLDAFDPDIVDDYLVWRRYGGTAAAMFASAPAPDLGLDAAVAAALQQAGWSYVGEVTAYQFDLYSYEAPTYADSTGAGEAPTEFMIMARNGGTMTWTSNVLAGHSVDNVAPGAPLQLTASLVGADGVLDWSPSGVDDADLLVYEVHRSTVAGFVPGPATFVAATADSGYVDGGLAPGPWYYVVAGRDVHGNLGAPSNEAFLDNVSAVGDRTPTVFAVHGAWPNPFNPRAEIRFDLPLRGHVRVEVFDARGRRVRVVQDGTLGPGTVHAVWDGRDDAGRASPSGVYFARVRTGDADQAVKLVLAK